MRLWYSHWLFSEITLNLTDVNAKTFSHWRIFSEKISEINIKSFWYLSHWLSHWTKESANLLDVNVTHPFLSNTLLLPFSFKNRVFLLPHFQVPKTSLSLLYPRKNFAWKHERSTGRGEITLKWWEYLVPISFASFSLLELCEICEPKQVLGPQLRNRYLNRSPF